MPTLAAGAIDVIVAQTAGAASTQTAALVPPTLTPTLTPPATKTPTQTPSPTPTFLWIMSTIARTPTAVPPGSGGSLGCDLVEQSPKDSSTIGGNQSFTASWKLRNTGTSTWDSNGTDFIYVSGAKLASVKVVDLPASVAPGDSVTLKVAMEAPGNNGTYKTVWTLRQGKQQFCRVNISIVVP